MFYDEAQSQMSKVVKTDFHSPWFLYPIYSIFKTDEA
jgi:hypothetical protein